MPSEKPWTSSSALPRNWILTKIMPPDCLAWQPGGVCVCGGFDGYGMTRRNVVYLPIYSRFQSTCHIRGMTSCSRSVAIPFEFQSTCHIRGMTLHGLVDAPLHGGISIHMPHTWHDGPSLFASVSGSISIHMPHTWHDRKAVPVPPSVPIFQSTCHIRGMTSGGAGIYPRHADFNPHATYVA